MSTTSAKSKTKTDPYADALAAKKQAHEDALAFLAETKLAVAEHRERAAGIEARQRSGDPSLTPAEKRECEGWTEILTDRLAAAERKVKAAELARPAEETRVADTVAPILRDLLADLPVEVGHVQPDVPVVPSVHLVQTRGTTLDTIEGTISGKVEVRFYRTPHHVKLDADAFERRAAEAAVACTTSYHARPENGHTVDVLSVEVQRATEALPVIARNSSDGWRLSHVGGGLAAAVERSTELSTGYGRFGGVQRGATVKATASTPRQVSERTDAEGVRRRTVELDLTVTPKASSPWPLEELHVRTVRAVEDFAGRFQGGLGRVTSAEVVQVEPSGKSGRVLKVRLVFSSALPRES